MLSSDGLATGLSEHDSAAQLVGGAVTDSIPPAHCPAAGHALACVEAC